MTVFFKAHEKNRAIEQPAGRDFSDGFQTTSFLAITSIKNPPGGVGFAAKNRELRPTGRLFRILSTYRRGNCCEGIDLD
jgi:hypothetical protein